MNCGCSSDYEDIAEFDRLKDGTLRIVFECSWCGEQSEERFMPEAAE